MFDSSNNNNKFYEAKLQTTSGDITVRYGRVGTGGTYAHYSGGSKKFNQLISSKEKKGYKQVPLNTASEASSGKSASVLDIALREIDCADDTSRKLVEAVAEANIHNITKTTNITYDSAVGMFKTPLGVIRKDAVIEAENILDKIESHLASRVSQGTTIDADSMRVWNDAYYVLIPNHIATTRDTSLLLYSQQKIDAQRQICKALLETLDLIEDLEIRKVDAKDDDKKQKIFDVSVESLADQETIRKITKYFDESKNHHHGSRLMNCKINRIYKISLRSQQEAFNKAKKEIGNVRRLWHGTRLANLLSILGKGLLLPKASPGVKAGAMFGDGLYFANQSSKSANYCDGMYWTTNGGSGTNKLYMFMASVAVGKAFVPTGPTGNAVPPTGYDSFWAKAGRSGVYNDEIVVFRGDQVRLDYLLEIDI